LAAGLEHIRIFRGNIMLKNKLTCEQVQTNLLEMNKNERPDQKIEQHLVNCPACKHFYELHRQLNNSFAEEVIPEAPAYIKHRLLAQLNPPVKTKIESVFEQLQNNLHFRFRTAIAFAFSLLFIALLWRPYIIDNSEHTRQEFLLYEQQDSLMLQNFYFVQNQNLGIASKDDTLLNKFLQVFP